MINLSRNLCLLVASVIITLFCSNISETSNIVNAQTSEPQYSNTIHLSSCGDITQSNTLYILDNDVKSEGTCFVIKASSVTLDLNGHTILYDDYPNSGFPNPDFELGNGDIPSDWDISQAPTAKRQPTAGFAMINKWYLYFDKAPNNTKIISPWTSLPPNIKAVVYFIRGDAIWSYQQAPLWNMKVEYEDGTTAFTKDFTDSQMFEFTTGPVEKKYKVILTLIDGYGLVLKNFGKYPSIDLFDLRPAYNRGIDIDYGKNDVIIKNGKIMQGRGKSFRGHGITKPDGSNLTVTNISFENYGMEASAVSVNWTSGVTIRDSNILNKSPYKLDRHQISAAVNVANSSNILVTNNTMSCGVSWGCVWATKSNIEVSYNNLITESVVTNHHAIVTYGSSNILIHHNIVEASPGQGILFSMSTDGEIYNNTITIKKTAPNFEYGYIQSDALTLKDYASKACKNLKVHDNTINLFGEYDKSYPSGGLLTGVMDGCTGGNVSYYNNKITARSIDPEVKVAGINSGGRFDYEEVFSNNIIESDMYNILFGGYAGQGDAVSNIKFISNTLIKGSNPTNYHTFGQDRSGQSTSDKTHFIDTRVLKGASLQDVQAGYYGYIYFVDWYLNISIKDKNGNPLPNVNVTIKDKNNSIVLNGTTDQGGKIERIVLSEFKNTKGTIAYFTPHTVSIAPPGESPVTTEIYMNGSKALDYQIGSSIKISDWISTPLDFSPPTTPTGLRVK